MEHVGYLTSDQEQQ